MNNSASRYGPLDVLVIALRASGHAPHDGVDVRVDVRRALPDAEQQANTAAQNPIEYAQTPNVPNTTPIISAILGTACAGHLQSCRIERVVREQHDRDAEERREQVGDAHVSAHVMQEAGPAQAFLSHPIVVRAWRSIRRCHR
jgi:hypothetical protein